MGLTPKQSLSSDKGNWSDLDEQLKLFIKSPGDTTQVNIERYPYSKEEIIEELKRNNYQVKDHGGNFIYVVG